MATAAVARSNQPPRRPRDPPRLSLGKRSANVDGAANMANKKRKLDEPYVWDSQYILQKHKGKPPSLIIHLHPMHFKFEGQDGSFAYDSEARFVVEHLKKQTVPHQMMLELLEQNTTFYDGCLIVEVHNHRGKNGKDSSGDDSSASGNMEKFSMHKYTAYITPSAYEAYPENAARGEETPEKNEADKREMPAPEKPKEKDGPQIFTVVLHPTELSRHHEMCILAETPAEQIRSKKRGSDAATPSSSHPGSIPPTPITQTARGQSQKMYLEADDMYSFEADVLVTTNPPLYLEPVDNPWGSEKVLEMLQHPLHQEQAPSPKTRKRTTAEVAADDAQQQETERRMLIMDERIKGTGAGAAANENQGAASSLTFSRFKTIDLVKTKLEEDKLKREEEQRLAQEKKNEENMLAQQRAARQRMMAQQAQQQAQQQQQQQPHQQQLTQQQQHAMMMRAQQQAMAHAQQQAQMNQHGHPQHNNMVPQQQPNMQQTNQSQMTQASPVVRQQTPMMNSSPMVQQGGFPMAQTSSQDARSPARPTSAAMQQHPMAPMARQVSQQQQRPMSRNATPQMAQGTPSMGQAMPNRQMAQQTPRMQPGSPAMNMDAMQFRGTPQMGNQNQFNAEQMAMLQQQARAMQAQTLHAQQAGRAAGSPPNNLTPEQIQQIQQQNQQQNQQRQHQAMRQHLMQAQAQAQAQGNPQMAAQVQQRQKQIAMLRQQQMLATQQQNAAMQGSPGPGQAAQMSPHPPMLQQTPQMGHAHPQMQQQNQMQNSNLTQEQRMAMAQALANQRAGDRQNFQQQQHNLQAQRQQVQQQLQPLIHQYGGLHKIPPSTLNSLPVPVKNFVAHQLQNMRQANAIHTQQQQQQQNLQQGGNNANGNVEQVVAGTPNEAFMQQLKTHREMLARQNQTQQAGGNTGGMNGMTGMSYHMNGIGGGPQTPGGGFGGQQRGQQGQSDLAPQFAAMQHALDRENMSQGGGQ